MHFHKTPVVVENFLPEAERRFGLIDFLQVTRQPAMLAGDFQTIAAASAGKFLPETKLPFVLSACSHLGQGVTPVTLGAIFARNSAVLSVPEMMLVPIMNCGMEPWRYSSPLIL